MSDYKLVVNEVPTYNLSVADGTTTQSLSVTDGVKLNLNLNGSTGPSGVGVPVGGTTGQALTKIDSTSYNTQWTDVVDLVSDQTIDGVKTFSATTLFNGDAQFATGAILNIADGNWSINPDGAATFTSATIGNNSGPSANVIALTNGGGCAELYVGDSVKIESDTGNIFLNQVSGTGIGSIVFNTSDTYTGSLGPSGSLTNDQRWTLPDATGTIALDSTAVMLSGDQSIDGTKTFNGTLIADGIGNYNAIDPTWYIDGGGGLNDSCASFGTLIVDSIKRTNNNNELLVPDTNGFIAAYSTIYDELQDTVTVSGTFQPTLGTIVTKPIVFKVQRSLDIQNEIDMLMYVDGYEARLYNQGGSNWAFTLNLQPDSDYGMYATSTNGILGPYTQQEWFGGARLGLTGTGTVLVSIQQLEKSSQGLFRSSPYGTTVCSVADNNAGIGYWERLLTTDLSNHSTPAFLSGPQTFSGAQSFSSTTRPTSSGTGTPAATSLITRDDGDTRYGALSSIVLAADSAGINNTIALQSTGLSLTLAAGTYEINMHYHMVVTNSPTVTGYNQQILASGPVDVLGIGMRQSVVTATFGVSQAATINLIGATSIYSEGNVAGTTKAQTFRFIASFTSTTTIEVKISQGIATLADPVYLKKGSNMTARKIA